MSLAPIVAFRIVCFAADVSAMNSASVVLIVDQRLCTTAHAMPLTTMSRATYILEGWKVNVAGLPLAEIKQMKLVFFSMMNCSSVLKFQLQCAHQLHTQYLAYCWSCCMSMAFKTIKYCQHLKIIQPYIPRRQKILHFNSLHIQMLMHHQLSSKFKDFDRPLEPLHSVTHL